MPRTPIPTALRRRVIERAGQRCEYCLLPQNFAEAPHEIDHLIAIQHGGQTVSENLALACLNCNRYKGSNLSAIDPAEGQVVLLFNPRTQHWRDHFELAGAEMRGRTPTGRATVFLLRFNDEIRVMQRQALIEAGQYPHDSSSN